jgi:hypothetical protein
MFFQKLMMVIPSVAGSKNLDKSDHGILQLKPTLQKTKDDVPTKTKASKLIKLIWRRGFHDHDSSSPPPNHSWLKD